MFKTTIPCRQLQQAVVRLAIGRAAKSNSQFQQLTWWLVCIRSVVVAALLFLDVTNLSAQSSSDPVGRLSSETLHQRTARLIEQLGDASYRVRVGARWELERIGLPALAQLREAMEHPNIQIAESAKYLVESQNVIWSLDNDSIPVKRLLEDYNDLNEVERETRQQSLASITTPDAVLALTRLARYESHETLSKSAALHTLRSFAKIEAKEKRELAQRMIDTVEPVDRSGSKWIKNFAEDSLDLDRDSTATWRSLLDAEVAAQIEYRSFVKDSILLRFYQWVGKWTAERKGKDASLDLVKDCLKFIDKTPAAQLNFGYWAIEAELPELIVQLATNEPHYFDLEPKLRYLLAEATLKTGDSEKADQLAAEASELVTKRNAQIRAMTPIDEGTLLQQHLLLAKGLDSRGLYAWAEREYRIAASFDVNNERTKSLATEALAMFYWEGGEFEKAAEALAAIASKDNQEDRKDLPNVLDDRKLTFSSYCLYVGLAEIEKGEKKQALEHLVQGLEAYPNPDHVIAMKALGEEEPYRSVFLEKFQEMSEEYRARIAEFEEQLVEQVERNTRGSVSAYLAAECNQLAWLLGKCEMNTEEAVRLSERSLELAPDKPEYLDTLARCHFAAKNYDKAVEFQRRAVKILPHSRPMDGQLAEFELALAKQQSESRKE